MKTPKDGGDTLFAINKLEIRPYETEDVEVVKVSVSIERDLNLYVTQVQMHGLIGILIDIGGLSYTLAGIAAVLLSL